MRSWTNSLANRWIAVATIVFARAVAAGAPVREPLATFVSGDRYASLIDPYGVRWAIMTRVEDLSPEESRRRVEDWSKHQEK